MASTFAESAVGGTAGDATWDVADGAWPRAGGRRGPATPTAFNGLLHAAKNFFGAHGKEVHDPDVPVKPGHTPHAHIAIPGGMTHGLSVAAGGEMGMSPGGIHMANFQPRIVAGIEIAPVDLKNLDPADPKTEILNKGPPPPLDKAELQHKTYEEQMEIKKEWCEATKAYDIARLQNHIAAAEAEDEKAVVEETMGKSQQVHAEKVAGHVEGDQNMTEEQEASVTEAKLAEEEQELASNKELNAQKELLKSHMALQRVMAHDCGGPERKPMISMESEQPFLPSEQQGCAPPVDTPQTLRELTVRMLQQETNPVKPDEGEYLRDAQEHNYVGTEPPSTELSLDDALQEGSMPMPVGVLALLTRGPWLPRGSSSTPPAVCATSCRARRRALCRGPRACAFL